VYEYLKLLEKRNLLDLLVKKGIVPITLAGHKLIYEVYLKEMKSNSKSQAITNTSIETKTPERTIYRIIAQMESK
jgi:hypothetical protein